jgi:hypothetical protein
MIIATHSSVQAFLACPRRYHLSVVERLKRVGERVDNLYLGTMVHKGSETIWRGAPLRLDAMIAQRIAAGDEEGAELAIIAEEMLAGYVQRWPAPEGVVSVEEEFELPIRTDGPRAWRGVRQAGKFDALRLVNISDDNQFGELQLVEHKTAAAVDGGYLERLWSDSQITGYCRAAGVLYKRPCNSVLYDVVIKPPFRRGKDENLGSYRARLQCAYRGGHVAGSAVRRRKEESDSDYCARIMVDGEQWDGYLREELIVTRSDIARWVEDLRDIIASIRRCYRTGRWPHHTRSCFDWQRPCEYLPICRAGDRVDACGVQYEQIATSHPELSEVAPE